MAVFKGVIIFVFNNLELQLEWRALSLKEARVCKVMKLSLKLDLLN